MVGNTLFGQIIMLLLIIWLSGLGFSFIISKQHVFLRETEKVCVIVWKKYKQFILGFVCAAVLMNC